MYKESKRGIIKRTDRKIWIFLLSLTMLISPAVLSGQGKSKKDTGEKPAKTISTGKVRISKEAAREFVLKGDFDRAISYYSSLLEKDTANVSLNGEYAYALALDGIYDAALSRLDRVWSLKDKSPDINFFISQVYALMGLNELAGEFMKGVRPKKDIPSWINKQAPAMLEKYRYRPSGSESAQSEDVAVRFKRANRMTAQNCDIQALAAFEGIISEYPGEYLPYVGYSIALEKTSLFERSAQEIEKAISITGNSQENSNTRQLLDKRLVTVKNKIGKGESAKYSGNMMKDKMFTAYAGGMVAESYISLNGKIGTYQSGFGSVSVDLGLSSASGISSFNAGVQSYYRTKKVLVAGYGLTASLQDGSSTVYFKISLGVSFMNKKKTSSFDIFLDGQEPLTPKGAATIMGLSMGRSVYFGKR